MFARIVLLGAGAPALGEDIAKLLAERGDVVAEIKAAETIGTGSMPGEAPGPEMSTRGHKRGDAVRYDRKGQDSIYGRVVDLLNGHAVVQFDGADVPNVMIGRTMDDLTVIEEPKGEPVTDWPNYGNGHSAADLKPGAGADRTADNVGEVASEDFHVNTGQVVDGLAQAHAKGEVQAVVTVALGSAGNIVVSSSEGTPLTLNLLAQAIYVADGTIEAADNDD